MYFRKRKVTMRALAEGILRFVDGRSERNTQCNPCKIAKSSHRESHPKKRKTKLKEYSVVFGGPL